MLHVKMSIRKRVQNRNRGQGVVTTSLRQRIRPKALATIWFGSMSNVVCGQISCAIYTQKVVQLFFTIGCQLAIGKDSSILST